MENADQLFSVWLLPDVNDAQQLNLLVTELSQQCLTPLFPAHLTLCSGTWNDTVSKLIERVDRIGDKTNVVMGYAKGLKQADSAHQFFYIAISAHSLSPAVEHAQKELPFSKLPQVGPHVSLMYSNDFTNIDRTVLAAKYSSKLPSQICFDQVALIVTKDNSWDEIANWQMVHIAKLQRGGKAK